MDATIWEREKLWLQSNNDVFCYRSNEDVEVMQHNMDHTKYFTTSLFDRYLYS